MDRGHEQTLFPRRYKNGQQIYEKMFKFTSCQGNANQNYNKIPPLVCQKSYYQQDKKLQMLKRLYRKRIIYTLLCTMLTSTATIENSIEIPQNIKNRAIIVPTMLLPGIYPENLKIFICKDVCTSMFSAALFTVAQTWKQPQYH